MSEPGRYYEHNGTHYWLQPVRRPEYAPALWSCDIYALPDFPPRAHPCKAGDLLAVSVDRPSAALALSSAECLIREMTAVAEALA